MTDDLSPALGGQSETTGREPGLGREAKCKYWAALRREQGCHTCGQPYDHIEIKYNYEVHCRCEHCGLVRILKIGSSAYPTSTGRDLRSDFRLATPIINFWE